MIIIIFCLFWSRTWWIFYIWSDKQAHITKFLLIISIMETQSGVLLYLCQYKIHSSPSAMRTHLLDTLRVLLQINFFNAKLITFPPLLTSLLLRLLSRRRRSPSNQPRSQAGGVMFPTLHICEKTPCLEPKSVPSASCCRYWVQGLVYSWSGYLKSLLKRKKSPTVSPLSSSHWIILVHPPGFFSTHNFVKLPVIEPYSHFSSLLFLWL